MDLNIQPHKTNMIRMPQRKHSWNNYLPIIFLLIVIIIFTSIVSLQKPIQAGKAVGQPCDIAELKQELATLEKERYTNIDRVLALQKDLEKLDIQRADLETSLAHAQEEYESAIKNVQDHESQVEKDPTNGGLIATWNAAKKRAAEAAAALDEARLSYETAVLEINNKGNDIAEQIRTLEETISIQNETLKDLENQLKNCPDKSKMRIIRCSTQECECEKESTQKKTITLPPNCNKEDLFDVSNERKELARTQQFNGITNYRFIMANSEATTVECIGKSTVKRKIALPNGRTCKEFCDAEGGDRTVESAADFALDAIQACEEFVGIYCK